MKLEILYKRAKSGDIQYWRIETEYNVITKESGKLGTDKPIKHKETCAGKNIGRANETQPDKQAEIQAESDWRKKRDEGYKSLEDLQIVASGNLSKYMWVLNPGKYERDVVGTLSEVLEQALPQFNTDASGNVKPMLATDWKKVKNVKYPVIVQPKLDGVRCLMIVNEPEVTFLSRSGKPYTTLDHIGKTIFDAYADKDLHGNFILDGEIYSDELTFQEITQAVKKQYPNSLKLHFRCYDIVNDSVQEDRIVAESRDIVSAIKSPFVHLVPYTIVGDAEEVKTLHDAYIDQGYEGAMIRTLDGKYEQGARSRTLLKVKEFDEREFEFVHWDQGQRPEDLIAVLKAEDDRRFRAKMVGTREQKEELKKTGIAGDRMTIKHFGFTSDGLPRFPIGKGFRDEE